MRHRIVTISLGSILLLSAALVIAAPAFQAGAGDKERINLDHLIDIKFDKDRYVLTQAEAARGVKFNYQVIVKEDIPGMIPMSQTSAGIGGPNDLMPLAKITGNGQFYGIIDVGLGPPVPQVPKTIKKGVYKRTLEWDGKNWTGPSDFNNPKGKPFPPGEYDLTVSMVGKKQTDEGFKVYKVERSVKVILKK